MFGSKQNIQKDLAELRQQIIENNLELQAITQVIFSKLYFLFVVEIKGYVIKYDFKLCISATEAKRIWIEYYEVKSVLNSKQIPQKC